MSKKKKKEKITYIDDGRTIADMSNVGRQRQRPKNDSKLFGENRHSFKSIWATYWGAVKMMFVPMLVVLGIISIAFLIMYIALSL